VHAAQQAMQLGAKVLTLSDSSGFILDRAGFNAEKIAYIKELKFVQRGRIAEYCKHYDAEFHAGVSPWVIPADIAMPCATQNELQLPDAQALATNGCRYVIEGANMPSTMD